MESQRQKPKTHVSWGHERDIHAVRWEGWRSSSSVEIAADKGQALSSTDDARPRGKSEHPVLPSRMPHRTARKDLAFFRPVFVDHGMRQPMVPLTAQHVVLPTHCNASAHVAHQLPGSDTCRYVVLMSACLINRCGIN
jgi:hypothetical protein